MTTAKERYDDFVKNSLAPFFKNKGFKKKGTKFIFYGDNLTYAFYPFRGKFNTKDYVTFAIYVDMYTYNFEKKEDLSAYVEPLIGGNIAEIIKNVHYNWVFLKTEDIDAPKKDQEMKDFFLDALKNKVLPYVFQFRTIADIIHLLETTPESEGFWDIPGKGSIGVMRLSFYYWLIGEKQKAIETLNKGIQSIDVLVRSPQFRKGALEDLEETKERILRGPDTYVRKNVSALI